ncbi:unnamed protein product [Cylicostephanus goldi]|uniref:Uncharacterized protein n=1 Tax=Cylicostephanus goldi TaxID=71465 RepID=A0A3P7LS06_CYLGO|nr:unnamed protein product [Cylicostephanus goldi]
MGAMILMDEECKRTGDLQAQIAGLAQQRHDAMGLAGQNAEVGPDEKCMPSRGAVPEYVELFPAAFREGV